MKIILERPNPETQALYATSKEREIRTRTVIRTAWGPNSNPDGLRRRWNRSSPFDELARIPMYS
ncbi:hypothetical protein YC2023_114361 [Brassica napus]